MAEDLALTPIPFGLPIYKERPKCLCAMAGFVENDRFRKLLFSFPGKAIELLYDHYYRSLVSIARNLTHDQKASEDIVQETFLHVWENHKQLGQPDERSIEHYLVRVVKNKAITHYKRSTQAKVQRTELVNGYPFNVTDSPIEEQIIRVELSQEIRKVIETFPRREKECLLMKLDEEMTTEQISERLNVTKKAVERSVTSANKRLRKYWLSKK